MAIVFKRRQKIQKNLLFAFAFIVLATLAVFLLRSSVENPSAFTPPASAAVKPININFDVLKSESLRELQPFPRIEVVSPTTTATSTEVGLPEKVGRDNPFIPY